MTFPTIFSIYIMRQMFKSFCIIGGGLLSLIIILDFVELINRTGDVDISINNLLYLQFLKTFDLIHSLFPYMTIFSMMHAFYTLNSDKEITVARSTGISGMQITLPAIFFAFSMGLFQTFALNHLSVTTYNQYQSVLDENKNNIETVLDISSTGLWLREGAKHGYRVINGSSYTKSPFTISDVNVLELSFENKFIKSYSADEMTLMDNQWVMKNSYSISHNNEVDFKKKLHIETKTTYSSLKNVFKVPNSISFWHLPKQIRNLDSMGLNATQHIYMFNFLLSMPLLYMGLAMLASFFTGRPYVRQQKTKSALIGLSTAFILFFYLNLIQSIVDILPLSPALVSWIPAITIFILGIYLMLNSEKVSG